MLSRDEDYFVWVVRRLLNPLIHKGFTHFAQATTCQPSSRHPPSRPIGRGGGCLRTSFRCYSLFADLAISSPLVGLSSGVHTRHPKALFSVSTRPRFHATSIACRIARSTLLALKAALRASLGWGLLHFNSGVCWLASVE